MPHASPGATQLASALTKSLHKLSPALTRPPEPDEIPDYCRTFLPQLEVAYVLRADERTVGSVELARLGREFDGLLLDKAVASDGVHYRLNRAHPWRGPFPSLEAAYREVWDREVCG